MLVVLYPKDTEKWKQFTTSADGKHVKELLFCIPKILKNESNSQPSLSSKLNFIRCFVSQRYWKMKAIHNCKLSRWRICNVVLYPKDTEKWKQFTTSYYFILFFFWLFCIPKILKNESNSQPNSGIECFIISCFVSQRYWKMKAIHNWLWQSLFIMNVVLYPKDTEKWKQFTTNRKKWNNIL